MATKTITLLDIQLGYGISAEQRAEIHRKLIPTYQRVLRRLLAEGDTPTANPPARRRSKR